MDQDNNINIDVNSLFPVDMTTYYNIGSTGAQGAQGPIGSNYSITTGLNYNLSGTIIPTNSWSSITASSAVTGTSTAGVLEVHGENADIKINGKSLSQAISSIEERLAILRPNPELEKDWSELKELGDQYRKLEAEIKEKMRVWDILKKE